MFAGIMFTLGMPSLLTPVSHGVKCVSEQDGSSNARNTHDTCSEYNMKADQIYGFGFDGQYFNLHIDVKLKDILPLNETVCFVWDPANKLQLADKDKQDVNKHMD